MISRTANADATAILSRSGTTRLQSVTAYIRAESSARLYIQLFNSASPTVGTDTPDMVLMIPPGRAGKQKKVKFIFASEEGGAYFNTGLTAAVTTTPNGNTSPASADRPELVLKYDPAGTSQ